MRGWAAIALIAAAFAPATSAPKAAASPPQVSVVAPSEVREGEAVTVTVVVSQPLGHDLRVDLDTRRGSAQPRADYGPVHLRLLVPAGVTDVTVSVPTVADGRDEPLESFSVEIGRPSHGVVGVGEAAVAIHDADPMPRVVIKDAVFTEPALGHRLGFTSVHLSHASGRRVVIEIETRPGTARPGDYVPLHPTIVFTPGVTRRPVSVELLSDSVKEPPETMRLVVTEVHHAVRTHAGTITILDAS